MSTGRPPHSVPTLTEVVDWPQAGPATEPNPNPSPTPESASAPASVQSIPAHAADAGPAAFDAAEFEQRVLADLQRQVELMLEVRLREALTPLLTRAADTLVRDARNELTATLREIVTRAVAQELARRRTP